MNYGKQSQMTSQLTDMEGYLFLLKCNCEFKLLDKQPPLFYSEMLGYFKELRTGDSDVYRSEFIFWNNKKITIENKSNPSTFHVLFRGSRIQLILTVRPQ